MEPGPVVPPLDESSLSLLDVVPDAMVAVDAAGIVVWINQAAVELLAYERAELIGQPVEVLVPVADSALHVGYRAGYARSPRRRPMAASSRLSVRRADGSQFSALISLGPVDTPSGPVVIAAVRDVSDWVASEIRLADERRRRAMAEDHERIARELHDTVIQELFAVGLGLQTLASERTDDRLVSRLDQAIATIDDTIRGIRRAIFDVRNDPSLALGARAAVADIVASMSVALGFEPRVTFVDAAADDMPTTVLEHVAPVVREALANVAKHAGAARVDVEIEVTDDEVVVRVIDDGRGFDPHADGRRGGLANMARRASLLGGSFDVTSAEGSGTRLAWRVPVRR